MVIIRFYAPVGDTKRQSFLQRFKKVNAHVIDVQAEKCYHIQNTKYSKFPREVEKLLRWILKGPQEKDNLRTAPLLAKKQPTQELIEVGPRFNFSTADSTNSVSICQNVGLSFIDRIEVSTRYLLTLDTCVASGTEIEALIDAVCDRMTECRYTEANIPRNDFYESFNQSSDRWYVVPVLQHGEAAIQEVDKNLGKHAGNSLPLFEV